MMVSGRKILWRSIRLSGKVLLAIVGSLALALGISWLGVRYAGSLTAFRVWLDDAALAAGLAIGVVWADRRAVVSAGAPLVASANRQPCRRSPHRVVDGGDDAHG